MEEGSVQENQSGEMQDEDRAKDKGELGSLEKESRKEDEN